MTRRTTMRAPREPNDGPFRRPRFEPESKTITSADGTQLHVQMYGPGDADPIVLIHGFTCAIEYWNPQIDAFAGKFRVIAFDQRGHGRSGGFLGPVTATDLADDLAAVLRETLPESRRATLVGHSMGGMTILAWAARYPAEVKARVSSALLANTATSLIGERLHLQSAPDSFTRAQGRIIDTMLYTRLPAPPLLLSRSVFRKFATSVNASPATVEFAQHISFRCPPRVRLQWATCARSLDVSAGVAALGIPTTVLYSALDGLVAPSTSKRAAAQVRLAGNLYREVELPGVGHASNLEAIEHFNAEISALRILSDENTA